MNHIQDIDNIQKAWLLATQLHEGQKYGGSKIGEDVDYINHIGSVVFEIMNALPHEKAMNVDLAVLCATLHDSVEDTSFTYEDVVANFGKLVADGVMALTKNDDLKGGKRAKMEDSLKRIKKQSKEIWMVKLADRIVNLSSVPHYWNLEKKKAYREEGRLILDELKEASSFLADRLREKIENYSTFY